MTGEETVQNLGPPGGMNRPNMGQSLGQQNFKLIIDLSTISKIPIVLDPVISPIMPPQNGQMNNMGWNQGPPRPMGAPNFGNNMNQPPMNQNFNQIPPRFRLKKK